MQTLVLDFDIHKTQYREYITTDKGKIVAKCCVYGLQDELPYATDLFVVPSERGKRYAAGLVTYMENNLIIDGFRTLSLACRKEDDALIETYKRMGFCKFMASRDGELIYMAKELL